MCDAGTTSFVWDILYGEGVVLTSETNGETTAYDYGLERISAITGKYKTEYVYDALGNVAAEVSYNSAWYTLSGLLSKNTIATKEYTPFGELLTENVSGFGYRGEYYSAETGAVYLRARYYEPELNRFNQKDILRGDISVPASLNRYAYVQNDPVNFVDPSGMSRMAQTMHADSGRSSSSALNTVKNTVKPAKPAVNPVASKLTGKITTSSAASAASLLRNLPSWKHGSGSSLDALRQSSLSKKNTNTPRVNLVSREFACTAKNVTDTIYILFSNKNKDGNSKSDFTDAANYLLQKNIQEKNVMLIAINTRAEFKAAWDSLPGNSSEVYMLFHSNGKSLIFEDGSTTEAYSVNGENIYGDPIGNIKNLDKKTIGMLYIYGCNSGQVSRASDDKNNPGNVAQAFSGRVTGSVIGVDGELAYGAFIAQDEYDIYFPRLSNDQGTFLGSHDIFGLLSDPAGFVEYKDGEEFVVIGGLPSPIAACFEWIMMHF